MSLRLMLRFVFPVVWLLGRAAPVQAQLAPEIGYMFPPGAPASTTVDVRLGGYDWTPDMQIFLQDPRITLQITGPPGPVLVPPPPYWFGAKGRGNDQPLPREIPARLTIPPEVPPGPIRWQVANANGASLAGVFWVGSHREVVESRRGDEPQSVESIPVVLAGQLAKIEEIDRYRFTAAQAGPVTCELFSRRLQTNMNGVLQIHDASGRLIAEGADVAGRDLAVTFQAEAGDQYTASLFDFDFRGDRSFVYRLSITPGPRVLATVPAACQRGVKQTVEFIGHGLASGGAALESVKQEVSIPSEPRSGRWNYDLSTPAGMVSVPLQLTDAPELTEPDEESPERRLLPVPSAVTGVLAAAGQSKRFWFEAAAGQTVALEAEGESLGAGADVSIAVVGPDGKQLARNDDQAATTDARLDFTVPSAGRYEVLVSNQSGVVSRAAVYRLSLGVSQPTFRLHVPPRLNLPIGETAALELQVSRSGGIAGPIELAIHGLPAGVTAEGDLVVPEGADKLKVTFKADPQTAAVASLASVTATAHVGGQTQTQTGKILVATTLKPPFTIKPEGLDDVRKVARGTTFAAPVLIQRAAGFTGEIVLEQTSRQQRTRQGISGPDLVVPSEQSRAEYPVFLPEWLETTKTSRIILNGVAKIPDPQGNVRHVVGKMELRIGMLPQAALLKLSHDELELDVQPGDQFQIPIRISRTAELVEPLQLEVVWPQEIQNLVEANVPRVSAADSSVVLHLTTSRDPRLLGEHSVTVRATVLQGGKLPVISETSVAVNFLPEKSGR